MARFLDNCPGHLLALVVLGGDQAYVLLGEAVGPLAGFGDLGGRSNREGGIFVPVVTVFLAGWGRLLSGR
ncbi:hypothetical protein ABT142_32845 [Streptomyces sp. NPDC001857]|uniref:hypothetical protein n=1 Tax=unclassified Streptomyces TaxID=2593676 RepID=UPI0033216959